MISSIEIDAVAAFRLARKWAGIHAVALVLPVLLLIVAAIRLPVLSGGQLDYDEGVYWQSLRAMAAGHALFSSVYSSQPPVFLLLLAPAHAFGSGSIVAVRGAVLILSLAGLVAVARVGRVLDSDWTGLAAVLLLSADPLFFRESVTVQADAPALDLVLIALAFAVESRRRSGRSSLLLAAGAGALFATALLTKLLVVPALPALAIVLAAPPGPPRRAILRLASVGLGAALVAAAVLLLFADQGPALWGQVIGFHLQARSSGIGGLDVTILASELPLVTLGIAGLFVAIRCAPLHALVGASWLIAATILLAVHRPLWPHHLLILLVPLALLGGSGVHLVEGAPKLVRASVTLLLVGMGCSALLVHAQQTPDVSRQPSVAALQRVTAPRDFVITDDQYTVAIAHRDTPPELVDTSKVRVLSGDLTTGKVAAIAGRSDVRAVLVDDHYASLSQLPGFDRWVREQYPFVQRTGHGRVLYAKIARNCHRDDFG